MKQAQPDEAIPAPFREMPGLVVEEFTPYSETQSNFICTNDGQEFQCTFWRDVIHLENARSIAAFENDYYVGSPAITQNTFGKSNAFYVGTIPGDNGMDWLIEQVCKTSGIQPSSTNAPAGVEIPQRVTRKSAFMFMLNHSSEKVIIPFEERGYDLLTDKEINGSVELAPSGVAVIQMKQRVFFSGTDIKCILKRTYRSIHGIIKSYLDYSTP